MEIIAVRLSDRGLLGFTPEQILPVLNAIPDNEFRAELPLGTKLSFGEALVYWVIEELAASSQFTPVGRLLLTQLFGKHIRELGDGMAEAREAGQEWLRKPIACLLVADNRYACCPLRGFAWYDMTTCTWLDFAPPACITTGYHLEEVAGKHFARLPKSEISNASPGSESPPPADGP